MDNQKKQQTIKWNTVQITGIGFMGIILLGAILLWLPFSNHKHIDFIDALFTSVSAVCVTGLVTIVPAVQFTTIGKCILLILIQVGGLGIIAVSTLFFLVLRMQISVKERVAILESYGMGDMGGIVKIVRNIIIGTLTVEGVGAVFYSFTFIPKYGLAKGIWYSIFHAISAFCNAGIDILGDSSLMVFATNPLVNINTIIIIVVSGIGFSVWFDVIRVAKKKGTHSELYKGVFSELTLHSKLAILSTLALIIVGTVGVLILEYNNPNTIGKMTFAQKVLASIFQSVTDRTAGFFTFSQGAMHDETKLINILLMFVGGSPGGTAGGVKTTTVALLFMTMISVITGGNELEAFGRRIPRDFMRTALAIVLIAISVLLLGTIAILILEDDGLDCIDVLYETTSAVCTVGLSANLTSTLSRGSQIVIMILMYIGRLGPMTMALMFIGKPHQRDKIRKLPKENIMIG